MTAVSRSADRAPRYVDEQEVLALVDPPTARRAVHDAFRHHAGGTVESPTRLALGDGRLLVMAARRGVDGAAVVKAVRVDAHGDPGPGPARGVDGLVLWFGDGSEPAIVADAGALTALRTAAMCAVATDLLAVPDARSLAVLGAGHQAREQVRAIASVRPIEHARIWNRTRSRAAALASELAEALPAITVDVADTASDALADADVVCCLTAAVEPLFEADAVAPHAHVNAVGSYRPDMAELPRELLTRASQVIADDRAACLAEAGEIVDAVTAGAIAPGEIVELSALIAEPPRRSGITVFKTVGVAVADLAVAGALAAALAVAGTASS